MKYEIIFFILGNFTIETPYPTDFIMVINYYHDKM